MNVYRDIPLLNNPEYEQYLHYPKNKSLLTHILDLFSHHPPLLLSRPLMLICETVNICNHQCIICPYGKTQRKPQVMELDVFEKVLVDYSAMGGGYLSLTPMIGDIFLDPLLPQRLQLISKYPRIKAISITTNAVFADRFSDVELQFIVNHLKKFHISVYGIDEEEYHTITQKNTYERMLQSIRKIITFIDKDTVVFGFRLFKNRSNLEIENWMQDNFGSIYPYNSTITYSNWGGAIDDSKKLPWNAEWTKKIESSEPCLLPLLAIQVFSNGDVSFCACADYDGDEELSLGNITKHTLEELFNSERVRDLWNSTSDIPLFCKECTFYRPLSYIKDNEHILENPLHMVGG